MEYLIEMIEMAHQKEKDEKQQLEETRGEELMKLRKKCKELEQLASQNDFEKKELSRRHIKCNSRIGDKLVLEYDKYNVI